MASNRGSNVRDIGSPNTITIIDGAVTIVIDKNNIGRAARLEDKDTVSKILEGQPENETEREVKELTAPIPPVQVTSHPEKKAEVVANPTPSTSVAKTTQSKSVHPTPQHKPGDQGKQAISPAEAKEMHMTDAPFGTKKDGTPAKKRGRPVGVKNKPPAEETKQSSTQGGAGTTH